MMAQDLVYALRSVRRSPRVAVVAIATLAVGIGAASAVFAVVDAVILRPLPFAAPDALVRIVEVTPDGEPFPYSAANYLDLRADTRTLASVGAYRDPQTMVLGGGDPERVAAVPMSASAFQVLGIRPVLGRTFTAEDDRPGAAPPPLVIADALWRRRFGGVPASLDRTVTLDGATFVIVGVMPPDFDFPRGADVWIPLRADPARDNKELNVIGRLSATATLSQARGEVRVFARRLGETRPQSNAGWSAEVTPLRDWFVAPTFRHAVWIIFGAVGALLLLACANVANLLVAHGASRQAEMRVRAALGASWGRIVGQLLTESAVLAGLGTAAGVLVASWTIAGIRALGSSRVPSLDQVRLDPLVLGFACLAGVASCLLAGLAPATQAAGVDLRAGTAGSRVTPRGRRMRQTLVVLEVAVALILLAGAGLLANSFVRLLRTDPGFDVTALAAMPIGVPPGRDAGDRVPVFYRELLDRVRAVPGVVAAAATTTNPFRQFGLSNNVTPEERAADAPPSGLVQAGWRSVTPGFLDAMAIPLLAGRDFGPDDRADSERVVIVSRQLARLLWPAGDAVGKRIYWGGTTGRTRTVVGVSGDFQDVHPGQPPPPMLLVPHSQVSLPGMTLVVRTAGDPLAIAPALRAAVRGLDAALPSPEIHDVWSSRGAAAAAPRFQAALVGAFAVIALVLAVTGVYAMLAFSVAERRREIAVRVALGARARDIVGMLLSGGLALTAIGAALGVLGAIAITRVLQSLLFEVAPTDPPTFAAAVVVLVAAAFVACYVPARRAGRIDPLLVLRE